MTESYGYERESTLKWELAKQREKVNKKVETSKKIALSLIHQVNYVQIGLNLLKMLL